MSHCAIITFKDGKSDTYTRFNNSWRGGARIWTALYDTYLKDPEREYDSWISHPDRLWDLAKAVGRLSEFEAAVLVATYDWAIVRKENFGKYAGHLREFVEKYPDEFCNLEAWAHFVENCESEAIGFQQTSVSETMWSVYDEETDESNPYDIEINDKHMFVYERLAELEEEKNTKATTSNQ